MAALSGEAPGAPLFQALVRFFGAVASALTGLGAICTAAGFLAERTRWSMLGLGSVSVDLNEYLFTGARFLAFLPGILLTTALSAVTGSGPLFLAALVAVGVAVAARWALRRSAGVRLREALAGWAEPRRGRLVGVALALLVVLQFAGTLFLFRAAGIRNLLFRDAGPPASCAEPDLPLQALVRGGCEARLDQAMGEVFLVVLASALLLWVAARVGSEPDAGGEADAASAPEAAPTLGRRLLLAANAALLAAQLVLLPINYGVLFLRNEFPVVEVARTGAGEAADGATSWPASGRFHLLQRRGDEFYLYSRPAARVWLVPRSALADVVYLGICRLFPSRDAPPSGTCAFDEEGA